MRVVRRVFDRREYEGEITGEGVTHAVRSSIYGLMSACGREVTTLWFTVLPTQAVTCISCIVHDEGEH